jgi:P-type Mg2+ transporter
MSTAIVAESRKGPAVRTTRGRLPFWSAEIDGLLLELDTTADGLTSTEAAERLRALGPAALRPASTSSTARLLARQFASPIVILLMVAALLSILVGETTDSAIILVVVVASGLLGFWQEHRAAGAVQKLMALVRTETTVLRDGAAVSVPLDAIVPGDVVVLAAGATLPADCRLIEAQDLFVDESALTGEAFPVQKHAATTSPAAATLRERGSSAFLGRTS